MTAITTLLRHPRRPAETRTAGPSGLRFHRHPVPPWHGAEVTDRATEVIVKRRVSGGFEKKQRLAWQGLGRQLRS